MEQIAMYLRLSKEDEFIRDESNSITNQRAFIREYINKDKVLRKMNVLEFVDDGFTGKNMDRPDMQRMLDLIKRKEISCVIVKDFSRFSRDHIEQGKYIEQIFPFMGVRFIAINDNYDSADYVGGIGEIDIAFKGILYDFFSEEQSQKVTTTLDAKRGSGKYIAAYAPYGYVKSPEDKHKLVVDEYASQIVKRIFREYISGNKNLPSNIWNKEDFDMCGLSEKNRFIAKIKHIKRCIRWSKQRIVRGYADIDRWDMFSYLQRLIPDMLQDLRDNRSGSPSYLGENYTNEEGILVNDTCHAEWDKILDKMIFLWRESREETCSRKNPFEEEYDKAFDEFHEKYGVLGEKLQTEAELEENRKRGGGGTVHFMDELPEYKDIFEKHRAEERKLEEYREKCKNEALDMLKEYFYSLWD